MSNEHLRQQMTTLLTEMARVIGLEPPVPGTTTNALQAPSPSQSISLGVNPAPRFPLRMTPQVAIGSATRQDTPGPGRSSVLSELRDRFSPYNARQDGSRIGNRHARRSTPAVRPRPPWETRCFCLGGPDDTMTPTDARKLLLIANGLGDSVLEIDQNATTEQLIQIIWAKFPKLTNNNFEFLRATTGGRGRPLVPISSAERIPSVSYLKTSRIGILFIRPLAALHLESPDNHNDHSESNASVDTAHGTGVAIHGTPVIAQQTTETRGQSEMEDAISSFGGNTSSSSTANTAAPGIIDVLTLSDYREHLYSLDSNEQWIQVHRQDFLEQILGVYKKPDFSYTCKPKVKFLGEAGTDIGALTKEYFWKGLVSISQDKLDGSPLFEGEPDHLLPSCDAKLVRSGVFQLVGKFMAHAALHCGIGFLGLSNAVAEYILIDHVDSDTPISIGIEDVTEVGIRDGLTHVRSLLDGAILTEEVKELVRDMAMSFDVTDQLTRENASYAYDHILYYCVIEKRKAQLEALKAGFRKTGILDFISGKMYLREGMFPRLKDIIYPATMIIDKLEANDDCGMILDYVVEFVTSIDGDQRRTQNLLSAWTGWPMLPEERLNLNVKDDVDFKAHACFNTIDIPIEFTKEQVILHFNMLIDYGASGFGAI